MWSQAHFITGPSAVECQFISRVKLSNVHQSNVPGISGLGMMCLGTPCLCAPKIMDRAQGWTFSKKAVIEIQKFYRHCIWLFCSSIYLKFCIYSICGRIYRFGSKRIYRFSSKRCHLKETNLSNMKAHIQKKHNKEKIPTIIQHLKISRNSDNEVTYKEHFYTDL